MNWLCIHHVSNKGKHEDKSFSKETKSQIWSIPKSNRRTTWDTFDHTKVKEDAYRFDIGADCMGFPVDQSDSAENNGYSQHMLDMGYTCVMDCTNTKGTLWICIWKRFLSVIRMFLISFSFHQTSTDFRIRNFLLRLSFLYLANMNQMYINLF